MTGAIRRFCAAFLTVAVPAAAADPSRPVWQGVWSGTVGPLPVRACLARLGDDEAIGAYFYLSRQRTIPLTQAGKSRVWTEGDAARENAAPAWTFADIAADRLSGSWFDGRRALAVRLTRVPTPAPDDADEPCGSYAFNAGRFGPPVVTGVRRVQDGVPYLKLTYTVAAFPDVAMESMALIGTDPVTRRINAGLRAVVPGTEWHECMAGELNARGADGDYEASLTPTLITARWLAATLDTSTDCGGAHPNMSSTPLTFDRRTGAAMKLEGWLNDRALKHEVADTYRLTTLRPAMKQLVIASAGDLDADCREAFENEDFWDIGLDRQGLSFTPELPHVEQACVAPVTVGWRALAPFLAAAGQAGRATFAATSPVEPRARTR